MYSLGTIQRELQNQFRGATTIKRVQQRAKTDPSPRENIHLFTYPRGGSTALAEVISRNQNCPIVWEPFFKGRKPFKEFDHRELWGWKEYISADSESATIDEYFKEISDRTFLHPRFFTGQSIKGLSAGGPLVYKYCFANYMAPYLMQKFNIKAVFLDRHIGQIIASRKKYGGFIKADATYSIDTAQTKNSNQLFHWNSDMRSKTIKLSVGVHIWNYCLSKRLIDQIDSPHVLRLDYDDMILNPKKVSEQLNGFIGTTIQSSDFKESSRTTVEQIQIDNSQLNKWKNRLTKDEITEMKKIVWDVFGFHSIPLD